MQFFVFVEKGLTKLKFQLVFKTHVIKCQKLISDQQSVSTYLWIISSESYILLCDMKNIIKPLSKMERNWQMKG